MIKRVCHAPVNTYFDVTPSGVIINRFSNDLKVTENSLPEKVRGQITNTVGIIFSLSFAAYNIIWILFFIPIMAVLCYHLLIKYNRSLKETSRIESISSSPILTHLSESISGTSTIRAYNRVDDFELKQFAMQDSNAAAILLKRGVKGWFNTKITFILTLFLSFVYVY